MARRIEGFIPGESREYIPKVFGNRESKDPIRVWIKQPTEKQKREIEGDTSVIRFAVDSSGAPIFDKDGHSLMEVDNRESTRRHHVAIELCVDRVENYFNAVEIVDGKTLADHGETALVVELYKEIMSSLSLSEQQAKKLQESPSSCSVETQV